jgi:thiosulfate/3-mercaptopyruvate sulfurtransferase
VTALLILIVAPAVAAASPLVDPAWVTANYEARGLVLLDVSPGDDGLYIAVGGESAVPFDVGSLTDELGRVLSVAEVEAALGEAGIDEAAALVFYDDVGGIFATYMYWMMDYLGQAEHYVLDGGQANWTAQGGELSAVPGAPAPTEFRAPMVDETIRVTREQMESYIADGAVQLVDSRDSGSFCAGHIPSSALYPWVESMTEIPGGEGGRVWRDAEALKERYAGLEPDRLIVVYCNRGVAASHNYFTLRMLGYPVVMYEGSWLDWTDRASYPAADCESPAYALLDLNAATYAGGDLLELRVRATNPGPALDGDLYVLLEAYGSFYFYPSWGATPDALAVSVGEAGQEYWTPLAFELPAMLPTAGPFYFHTALLEQGGLELLSHADSVSFGLVGDGA